MNFYQYYPRYEHVFRGANGEVRFAITNLTAAVKILEAVKARTTALYDYMVANGERPDTVATRVYGSPDYTWIVLVVNNIMSLYDWPLQDTEFADYITERYGSIENAQNLSLHPRYYTTDGFEVDYQTWLTLAERQGDVKSAYDVELEENEAKRRIKVVPMEFVGPLMIEMKRVFV